MNPWPDNDTRASPGAPARSRAARRLAPRADRAIVGQHLRHFGSPDLDRQVAAAIAKRTGRGWRLDHAERSGQVDAVIALAMACERAQHRAEPVRLLRCGPSCARDLPLPEMS